MKFFKTSILIVFSAILITIFTPLIYIIDKTIFGEVGFLGEYGRIFIDFFISYSFFTTLFLVLFGGKRKYIYLAVLLVLELLILFGIWEVWAILAGTAFVAWLIAQTILVIKKKISKK
jgi:hypothetical protein